MIPSLSKIGTQSGIKRLRELFADEQCNRYTMSRSEGELSTVVYEFPNYTEPSSVAALALVCKRLRDYKRQDVVKYKLLRNEFPFVVALDKDEMLSPSIEDTLTTMTQDATNALAVKLYRNTLAMLYSNGFSADVGDITFVSTTPGEESEMYHRDGGADDNTFRMIIYGTNYGPGTNFADGDCNLKHYDGDLVRDSTNSTGFAPKDWDPTTTGRQEIKIAPNGGNAVLFTGNVCHKRQSSHESRWGILFNLQYDAQL
jgi:hypothetical protein